MDVAMAARVKKEQGGEMVCSPADALEQVMDMPSALCRHLLVTDGACPFVFSPSGDERSAFEPAVVPRSPHALVQGRFPDGSRGMGFPPQTWVASNGCLGGWRELNGEGIALLCLDLA